MRASTANSSYVSASFSSESVAVAFDLATRRSIAISPAMRESLKKHLVPELSV